MSFSISGVDGLFIILSGAAPAEDELDVDGVSDDGALEVEPDEGDVDELLDEDDGDVLGLVDELEDDAGGVLGVLVDEDDEDVLGGVDGLMVVDDDFVDGVTTGGVVGDVVVSC